MNPRNPSPFEYPINALTKRVFDFILAFILLILLVIPIFVLILLCSIDTNSFGVFVQRRIGRFGRPFKVFKLKTMRDISLPVSSVTVVGNPRITKLGAFLRRLKLDELPQIFNVLIGDMSFVGPRPDVPGFADQLIGESQRILFLRPGITGAASIAFKNEEQILASVEDPIRYNKEFIWPEKVRINLDYYYNWNFLLDLRLIFKTLLS